MELLSDPFALSMACLAVTIIGMGTPRRLDNQTYAGTTSVLFALVNWVKMPGFVAFGALNRQTLMAAVVLMPLAIITTLVAVRVIRRLDTARFYTMIHIIMVLLGGKLIWDGVT